MGIVHLSGQLVCADDEQARSVERNLALHRSLTRAEPGCISFDVTPTDDPLIWQVDECFRDVAVFRAHQRRVATSDWGRATAGFERRYAIEER